MKSFTINFNIGAGLLALPLAFYNAGWLLSLVTLTLVCSLSYIACLFVLEAMARAPVYKNFLDKSYERLLDREQEIGELKEKVSSDKKLIVSCHKFEFPELCELFLGEHGKRLYSLTAALLFYGTLASLCCIFSTSLSCHFGIFGSSSLNFYFYLFIFSLVVIPLSCCELSEQYELQIFLTYARSDQ